MKEIEKNIKFLESDSSMEDAFFAFYQDEENQDNEHIKANADGLKQFASFLLRIAYNIEPKKSDYKNNTFPIDNSFYLPEDSSIIKYIELKKEIKSDYKKLPKHKTSWKDYLVPIGCGLIIMVLFVFAVIGIMASF